MRSTNRGNAIVETIVALAVLSPFLGCIALLGKQLDVKHKTFDALRYSVWERTVWTDNAKADADVRMEALDRTFGAPNTGVTASDSLRSEGVSQNPLWRHHRRSLLTTPVGSAISFQSSDDAAPVDAGYLLMPGLAHGTGPLGVAATSLRMDDLNLNRHSFVSATIEANLQPLLAQRDSPLTQRASGALLSDTWSPRDENEFGRRVDRITASELIEALELPGRVIAMQALTKGGPLYGEGQYGWDPQLRPRSNALPAAYVVEREGE
ncbi:hypothetical protein [Steroidobacter cummioxidans]|uniref:hypothetical protein n=1 Tax=Steroidobacter cummioxidans TaxID=1803913 RepID=UPI000E31DF88|nr:hypothetical protein [Steroidobacter cummioxidans]